MSTVTTEIRNSQTNSHQAQRNRTENQEICPNFDIQTTVNFTNQFFQFWMQPIPELNEIHSLQEHKTCSSFLLSKNAEEELPCKHKQNDSKAF